MSALWDKMEAVELESVSVILKTTVHGVVLDLIKGICTFLKLAS
jgi:hypothetical protein